MKAPHRIGRISVRVISRGVPSDNVAADFFQIGQKQEVTYEVWPIPAAFYRPAPTQQFLDITEFEVNDDRRKGAPKITRQHLLVLLLLYCTYKYVTDRGTNRLRALSLRDIFLFHIFFALLAQL
jgi:hypothetical protein